MPQMNELGFYTLAGAPESPRELLDEVRQAEAMDLGSVFVSERLSIKEAVVQCGAAGAMSERMGVATGATNHHLAANPGASPTPPRRPRPGRLAQASSSAVSYF